ncbi:MAG: hypothetical protein QM703_22805 [Gemmatales bacterium]
MNEWLVEAIEDTFFADDGIELEDEHLACLTDEDLLDLIWQFHKFDKAQKELSYFHAP